MQDTIKIALIYGSARENRFCETVVRWVLSELSTMRGIDITLVDPADLTITAAGLDAASAETVEALLSGADAFLIAVPEYNHGYPAALKAVIDSAYRPWHAKPVAFVSYGGVSGGLRAVEQLRQVFAELHAVTIRDTVSLAHVWALFDSAGHPLRPGQMNGPLLAMMARLLWWARALKRAREEADYEQVAA